MTDPDRPSHPVPDNLASDPRATFNPRRLAEDEELTVLLGDTLSTLSRTPFAGLDGGRETGPKAPGSFHLRAKLGHGGQGEVWEALQVSLNRPMALKRLRREWTQDAAAPTFKVQAMAENFRREALTMALLDHPGVLPIFDFWEDAGGHPILSMKRVEGLDWEHELAVDYLGLPYPDYLAKHLAILVQVVQTVAYAHSKGILHRDLKPSQVMLGRFGEVWLLDWGLAVAFRAGVEGPVPLREASNPAGSPAYMAPEQTRRTPEALGPHTDVYLLGGLLYEILCGQPPHGTQGSSEAFLQAARGIVDPLEAHRPARDWPEDLAQLAFCALALEPDRRPGSAQAFLEGLQAHLSGRTQRAQAEQWLAEAEALDALNARDYGLLSQALGLLHRALEAWPGHPRAALLRQRLLERQVTLALDQDDLGMAEATALRLLPSVAKTELAARIQARRRALARLERTRKRALAATGTLGGLILLLLAKGYLDQRAAARTLLEHRQRAEALTVFMLKDLRDALEPVGKVDLLGSVADKARAYYESLPPKSLSPQDQLQRAGALTQLASLYAAQNAAAPSRKALASALALLGALPAATPGLVPAKTLALGVRGRSGFQEGHLDEALRDYREGIALLESSAGAALAPATRETLMELCLGASEVLRHANRMAEAQALTGQARAHWEALKGGAQPGLRRDRLAFNLLEAEAEGFMERAQHAEARRILEEAAAHMEGMIRRYDGLIPGRVDLAETHQRLGDVLSLTEQFDASLEHYRTALDWARSACTLDPGHASYRDKLGMQLNRVAQLHLNAGRPRAAAPLLEESEGLYRGLAEGNPDRAEWRSRQAYVEGLQGWRARLERRLPMARDRFHHAAGLLQSLSSKSPENKHFKMEWAIQLIEEGHALKDLGRVQEAEGPLLKALELLKALRAEAPHPVQAELMAEAYVYLGRSGEARPFILECIQAKFMAEEARKLAKEARIPLP